ncbi:phosphotransferase [Streptomyces vinaceus]|uniref:phosphotransferase n=1 Tax=Streptomyces vinaceus TaxID=1960 RepID=UPI0036ADC2A3
MTDTRTDITEELIRDLLREQHPDLADRPLELGALGWDNQVWRLGDDLAVRLPWATESADGTFCGVIDFGDLFAGDPACDLAAAWILLPDGAVDHFHRAYRPAPDAATLRRARGWAVLRALGGIHIGHAGVQGHPGDKPTCGAVRTGGWRRWRRCPWPGPARGVRTP